MNTRNRLRSRVACTLVVLVGLVAPAALASDLSAELKSSLKVPLLQRVKELTDVKDEFGANNVRASFYDNFMKIDDDTYQVFFLKRIALADHMNTEQYLVTLKKGASGSWAIAEEKLERTVDNLLFRSVPNDETAHAFDSFSFDREGMKLSGGKGTAIIDYWRGKPFNIRFIAEELKYEYNPPVDTDYYSRAFIARELLPNQIAFTPERAEILCEAKDCEQFLAENFKGLRDTEMSQVHPKVLDAYKEENKKRIDARKDEPMSGFQVESRPGRSQWSIRVKRDGAREHWAWLDFDSEEPEEVRFVVSGFFGQPIYTYYSEATRNSGASPYDLELRPDSDALDYDLVSVKGDVNMAVESPDSMDCVLDYKIRIKRDLDAIHFRIDQVREGQSDDVKVQTAPSFSVRSMTDGNGKPLTFIQTGGSSGYIALAERLKQGDQLEVQVDFVNKNSIYKLNPSYSYVSRGGWMPFVRFGDMIDEFDLSISVPEQYTILGVGHVVDEKVANGLRTTHFSSRSAVTFPTVIFGNYIQDAPRFKATKLDGADIPVNIYVDKTSTYSFSKWQSQEELVGEVNSGIQETRGDSLRPLAEQAANSLNLYREIYGVDYPFGKLDLVNDPIGPGFYGQAPASIVYLGAGVFRGVGEVASFGGQNISRFQDSVVPHEVAHQWWGGLVTNANQRHYWFVESLAEYSSALFLENFYTSQGDAKKGQKAYLNHVADWRRTVMMANAMASVQDVDTMWQGEIPGLARTAAIYNQGPYAFHILRMTFGDEKFFAYLQSLAQDLAGKEITTRDIQNVAEKAFGGNMDWFFDQWIRGVGLPQYQLTIDSRRAEDNTFIVEGTVKQRIVAGPKREVIAGKTFRGMVILTVTGKDGQEYPVKLLVEDEETPFAFKVPVKPVTYALNKNGEILAHDALINRDW